MKKSVCFLLFILFFFSCKKENSSVNNQQLNSEIDSTLNKIDTLSFISKKFEKYSVNKSDTSKIKIEIPYSEKNQIVSDSIHKLLLKEFSSIFSTDSLANFNSFDAICNDFIAQYKEFLNEDSNSFPWEATATAYVDYQTPKIVNIYLDFYSFTGGAHGYSAMRSFFIDAKTGKQIKTEDLFTDIKNFTKFAEEKFRKQQNIPKKANINETGYWFTDEKFHLPKNIFLSKKGIRLIYNQYEIASYAEGPIELLIPQQDAIKFLKN